MIQSTTDSGIIHLTSDRNVYSHRKLPLKIIGNTINILHAGRQCKFIRFQIDNRGHSLHVLLLQQIQQFHDFISL